MLPEKCCNHCVKPWKSKIIIFIGVVAIAWFVIVKFTI